MYAPLEYPEGKTNYQIIDEHKGKTTITLEKWVADILQEVLPNVHDAVQHLYNKAHEKFPEHGRKARGNIIRRSLRVEADKHQNIKKKYLGWNDDEIILELDL